MICAIASSGEEVYLSSAEAQVLKQRMFLVLLSLFRQGYTDFYVNCNYGVPMWAAEMLCKMKMRFPIRVHIAAPHEQQCEHWLEHHRERYMAVHEKADTVTFVSKPDDSDSYRRADEYMAERSNLLLVYDTQNIDLYIVDYATDLDVQVQFI